ncbi:hypothetical protein [Adlercreutzia muris]|uniref:hypothetical protein n=1 Tax=Adlercreutzia muris TaxID=1796610 RepID=UPI003513CF07
MPTVIKGQPTSQEVLQTLADLHEPVALGFSCGKDSIATWIAMREYGIEVVPVYFWLVPDLQFIDDELAYFEEVFETRIHRYPNPSFYRLINSCVDQPPERLRVIEAAHLPTPDYPQTWDLITDELGLPRETWKADGVRAADSLNRRSSFVQHGVMKPHSRKVSPIADWLKQEVMDAIDGAGIKLPIDYEIFGRSFDGIDCRFTEPMRKHLPDDYERLRQWFPLMETDLIRKGADPDGF